jgi:hypothetical protein
MKPHSNLFTAFLSAAAVGSVMVVLLSALSLFAQETPVAPEGTQVATEETPAAAANADALHHLHYCFLS